MDKKQYLTQEKYDSLVKELNRLETVDRKEVVERLEYARSLGDLSENAEYHDARNAQGEIECRIQEIQHILKYAEIIKHKKVDQVGVGSIVIVEKAGSNDKTEYTIVGSEDADANLNKISHSSPLGNAMMGKKKNDEFLLKIPKGTVKYKIISIE